jgi:(E)-4-hydroxy-3-methylbut-2-enyl-diphosphate synthase
VPRDKDVRGAEDDRRRVADPVIADIHFNHTLALKAIDAARTASA